MPSTIFGSSAPVCIVLFKRRSRPAFHAVASLARALDDNVERGARLTGEWKDEPRTVTNIAIMNLPGVASVISGITCALADYPEARQKVIEYLRSATDTAALPAPEQIDVAAE